MTEEVVEKDPRYGWIMVAVVFVLSALSFGALAAISVFLKPLTEAFGWSRGTTSLGYTTIAFSSALFGVFWGFVADRYGTRWFGVIAALVMTFCLFMLSRQSSLCEFFALYFLFGAFGNAMLSSPLFANVGFWFRSNPGLALGITASGGAVGQGVIPFLIGIAITNYGWQQAYLLMAIGYFVIALPIAFLIRESPRRIEVRNATVPEVREFPLSEVEVIVWISVAVIFCCNCMSVPIVHLVPLLTDVGQSVEYATSVLLALMLAGGVGRIMAGKIGDIIGALPAYMIMSAGQTLSAFMFPHVGPGVALYLLAMFFGFTYSGVMTSILFSTRMMVSARFSARSMSLTSFFGWNGMGMGGFFGGYLFDQTGDYDWSFAYASIAGAINLIVLSLFYIRIKTAKNKISTPSAAS
ncbi:MAG: MFS transporter [Pseudomonadales bacterium]|nr:MFS transporter [Pseudomonadales bacterium]